MAFGNNQTYKLTKPTDQVVRKKGSTKRNIAALHGNMKGFGLVFMADYIYKYLYIYILARLLEPPLETGNPEKYGIRLTPRWHQWLMTSVLKPWFVAVHAAKYRSTKTYLGCTAIIKTHVWPMYLKVFLRGSLFLWGSSQELKMGTSYLLNHTLMEENLTKENHGHVLAQHFWYTILSERKNLLQNRPRKPCCREQ